MPEIICKQKSEWGKSSIATTSFIIVLFITLGAYMFFAGPKDYGLAAIILECILAAMCIPALCYMPLSLRLDKRSLDIAFSLRAKSLPLSQIKEAREIEKTGTFYRLCGSGGFFGYWGLFGCKGMGRFMLYAGNLDSLLLVELKNGKKYIISCTDPEEMAKAVNAAIS